MRKTFNTVMLICLIAISAIFVGCVKKKPRVVPKKNNIKTVEINLGEIDPNSIKIQGVDYTIDSDILKIQTKNFPITINNITPKETDIYFKDQRPAIFEGYWDANDKEITNITGESKIYAKFSEDNKKYIGCFPQSVETFEKPEGAFSKTFEVEMKYGLTLKYDIVYYKGKKYEELDGKFYKYEKVLRDKNPMGVGEWSSKVLDYVCYDRYRLGEEVKYKNSFLQKYLDEIIKKKMGIDNITLPIVEEKEIVLGSLPTYPQEKLNINEDALTDYARYKTYRAQELSPNSLYNWETTWDGDEYLKIWTRSKENKQNHLLTLNYDGNLESRKSNTILGIKVVFI